MSEWKPIDTAPKDVPQSRPVDLWLHVYASPRSMGMSDSFRVVDCWRRGDEWVHLHNGTPEALFDDYITHWMPAPPPPREGA